MKLIRARWLGSFAFALWMCSLSVAPAQAQVFGTFPWQMQPYCNTVTLSLINSATGFTLEGVDDQCGAVNKGSAVGTASFNSSGNVTLNFTIVTAPGGKPVSVSAVVSPATGSGTWTDSLGNSGTFAFFGATPALPARPSDEVEFRVRDHAAQTVTGASTPVVWTALDYNNGGGVYSAGTGSYTIPRTGLYQVDAGVIFGRATSVTTSQWQCVYLWNQSAVTWIDLSCLPGSTTGEYNSVTVASTLRLTAGTVLQLRVNQGNVTGASLSTVRGSHLSLTLVR